jgi:hypothetical protein
MKGNAMPVEAGLKTLFEIQGIVLDNTLGHLDSTHLST